MQWLITYTKDFDTTRQEQIIAATTYTQAIVTFLLRYEGIVLEIKKI
jgi:hypothetical protein